MKRYVRSRIDRLVETSRGFYDDSRVEHLRGIVTLDKAAAYRIICDFMRSDGSIKSFIEDANEKTGLESKTIQKIIEEKASYDVAVTYKIERNLPIDYSLKSIRRAFAKP